MDLVIKNQKAIFAIHLGNKNDLFCGVAHPKQK
jgi:hypothetical protein